MVKAKRGGGGVKETRSHNTSCRGHPACPDPVSTMCSRQKEPTPSPSPLHQGDMRKRRFAANRVWGLVVLRHCAALHVSSQRVCSGTPTT
jgi:hypothetical protein